MGSGIAPKVSMAAFIAFFPLLIDTAAGLASVDADETKLFRSVRPSGWQQFFKLEIPSAAPFVFAGLKTASVLAVVGAVVAEMLGGGQPGLGQLIRIASTQLRMDRVFSFVIILSVLGYAFYGLVAFPERKLVFWRTPHLTAL